MTRTDSDRLDESLVALFRTNGASPLDWRTICESLGVDLSAAKDSLVRLESAGYRFENRPDRGLSLLERPSLLVHTEVFPDLETRWLGRAIRFYREVDSTNDLLLEASRDEPEGLVIFAEEQRKGRGRQGRRWEAPPGRALQFSLLLRPKRGALEASDATLAAAAGMALGLAAATGIEPRVRWPNDLSVDGRKLCGILSEFRTVTGNFVIGIGLNVNQTESELPEGATSLRVLLGENVRRGPLLAALLRSLETQIEILRRDGFEPVRRIVEERSSLIGRQVELQIGRDRVGGLATAIGPAGGLVLRDGTGEKEYCVGEVTRVVSWERNA